MIDSEICLSQHSEMLSADEIREELIRQLDGKTLTGASVARTLGIAPARVTEMKNRERKVQQEEMQPLAQLLDMVDPVPTLTMVQSVTSVQNWGKVAQDVWLEQTEIDPDDVTFVAYDRLPGDTAPVELFAVTPEGASMNQAFMPGVQLICRRIGGTDEWLLDGDYVIAERSNHDLRELTCKRVRKDDRGRFWLHSESSDARFVQPWLIGGNGAGEHTDIEVRVIGKVIRAVQNFERA